MPQAIAAIIANLLSFIYMLPIPESVRNFLTPKTQPQRAATLQNPMAAVVATVSGSVIRPQWRARTTVARVSPSMQVSKNFGEIAY